MSNLSQVRDGSARLDHGGGRSEGAANRGDRHDLTGCTKSLGKVTSRLAPGTTLEHPTLSSCQ